MRVPVLLAVSLVALVSGGCPEGIGSKNSLTFHNKGATDVFFLSITRTGDVGEKGVNLLSEPIEPSGTFTKSGLMDGVYYLEVRWINSSRSSGYGGMSTSETIEGGGNHDWYFTENANATAKDYVWTYGGPVFLE